VTRSPLSQLPSATRHGERKAVIRLIKLQRPAFPSRISHSFSRLDVTLLLPGPGGIWRREGYRPDALAYPASCVKLAYLAAAMYWQRTNGLPYKDPVMA
jgi:protein phosphatase methylesterase 1